MVALSSDVFQLDPKGDADEQFFHAGFTDGLPVVLPTRTRVTRMLRGTMLQPSHVIGKCPPSYFDVTVEKLAIAAVMAGCTPEMFRIVLAAATAMLSPQFGLHGVHATTMGATPVVIVNGDCRHDAKVNFRHAPCGSGNRSTTIGRALKLLIQNVGRAKLAGTESTTIGTPMKFGLCFAEWEERCGMWEPLSMTDGSAERNQDAVTVFAATSGPVQMVDVDSSPEELIERLAKTMAVAYAPQIPFVNHCLLVVSPEHYDTLVKAGMRSKAELARVLWRKTAQHMIPHIGFLFRSITKQKCPKIPSVILRLLGSVLYGIVSVLSTLGFQFSIVPKFSSPDSFKIVVAGGQAGKFSSFMPSFGVGKPGMPTAGMSKPVTALVESRPAALDTQPPHASPEDMAAVLTPSAQEAHKACTMAKRNGSLLAPVALLDISKGRGSELLDAFEIKLHAMGVETRRFSKPTFSRPCPEALLKEVVRCCRSAIIALAD
eukprot:TRINITY_DN48774_c0_g1_i1.p1 TRINITY_DN48774_c0_g1~~TRINITY_DN48774_c0_g1_i1.p1  ORF type:complete len:488 (-),score=57.76 TRINITY_DN48774_c0_g1_i1:416-1879(-)